MKKAIVTGITGQDGAYLAQFLLSKNYIVYGAYRRTSSQNFWRIEYLGIKDNPNLTLIEHDLIDPTSTIRMVSEIRPDEIYNLAAQSFVHVSFDQPIATSMITGIGVTHLLEAIRIVDKSIKFYQASTSELYGKAQEVPQKETTPFYPRSPYGVAKLYSHWITVNYRESYKIFAANGILFNHESPLRGETFVTKKVVKALCNIKYNKQKKLFVGNLYSKRDWGHAADYVNAMWKILQHKQPEDFVICTGKQYTIKQFINMVAKELDMKIQWKGKGIKEKAYNKKNVCIIECNKKYLRPAEVDTLKGNFSKAKKILKWKPKHTIKSLIKDMIKYELDSILK